MPRRTMGPSFKFYVNRELTRELADELKLEKQFGQPLIEEEHYDLTGLIRVNVLWDRWQNIPHEYRSSVILNAYKIAESKEFADRITLATGLTFPEAHASGMLPFRVIAALRQGDAVTADQCRQAMIEEGASTLQDPNLPQLRFATEEEAEACLGRLSARLPESEQVWQILREVGQDLELS